MSRRRRQATEDVEITDEQCNELKEAFDLFDVSKKGYIERGDLRTLFKQYSIRVSDEDLDDAFKAADADGDKKVTVTEFINMMSGLMKSTSTEAQVTEAFKVFDPEEKGVINDKELSEALLNIGEKCTTQEVNELRTVAKNQEGDIRYELFVNAVFAKK